MNIFELEVHPDDRSHDVSILGLALRAAGISLGYVGADLVFRINAGISEKGGQLTLSDMADIQESHKSSWIRYANLKNNK